MPATTLEDLRCSLEDERRNTLSFSRALDHIDLAPSQLDRTSLRALHERDADAAELLYGLERGHITAANVIAYRDEADAIRKDAERLRAKVRSALPKPFQKRLDLALQVATSTVTLDDVYADIRDAP